MDAAGPFDCSQPSLKPGTSPPGGAPILKLKVYL
jgi:hypothetical protein